MKISKHFTVQELVHPDIIRVLGEERAINTVSVYALRGLEGLRLKFGPVIVNDGSKYTNSGLRKASFYKKLGLTRESYSTHLYGNTFDTKYREKLPVDVYNYILENQEEFPFIIRMENAFKTKTWLHIEFGRARKGRIEVFNP